MQACSFLVELMHVVRVEGSVEFCLRYLKGWEEKDTLCRVACNQRKSNRIQKKWTGWINVVVLLFVSCSSWRVMCHGCREEGW